MSRVLARIVERERKDANEMESALSLQAKAWRLLAIIATDRPEYAVRKARWLLFSSVPFVDGDAVKDFIDEHEKMAKECGLASGVFDSRDKFMTHPTEPQGETPGPWIPCKACGGTGSTRPASHAEPQAHSPVTGQITAHHPAPSPEELAEDDLQFIAEAEEIVARTIRDRRDANRFNRLDYRRAHLLLRLHNSALRPHQAPSRDAGWVMVPREPTAQMLAAMATVYDAGWNYPQPQKVELDWAEKSYAAMLTAAPGAGKGEV